MTAQLTDAPNFLPNTILQAFLSKVHSFRIINLKKIDSSHFLTHISKENLIRIVEVLLSQNLLIIWENTQKNSFHIVVNH